MAEDWTLPGVPKKKLVREVKSQLWRYGLRPVLMMTTVWKQTWAWAAQIAHSYKNPLRSWPHATEIATQYIVLLLADMKENHALRLPYRAMKELPEAVALKLGATPPLALPQE
jgi:hypothetical protein